MNLDFENNFTERRSNTYAAVIYLPRELNATIAPFREKYDPFFDRVDAHITLVFPFDTTRTLDEISTPIKHEAEKHKSIDIELQSIADFYPDSPVIYWEIKKNEQLCDLYYRFYSCLGLPIPVKDYIPHVTIAREISSHRVINVKDAVASYLPQEKFTAVSIDLVTPLMNGKWVSVRNFSLAR